MPFKSGKSGNDDTKFKPGKSGNPKGRSKTVSILRELQKSYTQAICSAYAESKDEVIKKIMELAKGGDPKIISLLHEIAFDKKIDNVIEKLATSNAAAIGESQSIIINKMASGEIEAAHGIIILNALKIRLESHAVQNVEARLDELLENKN